jgi:hypothetical protein
MGFGIGDAIGGAFDAAKDAVGSAADAAGDAFDGALDTARDAADAVGDVASDVGNAVSNASISDIGHTALDVAGMVPVVGEVADLANAGWYAAEGDYTNAALSAAGAIPFAGNAATAAKWGKKAVDAADTVSDVARAADRVGDVARTADNIGDAARAADNVGDVARRGDSVIGATPNSAIDVPPAGSNPPFTFRGDARGPDEIFDVGFQPRGTNTDLLDYAANNTPSIYVSTSKSADVGADFATNFGSRDGFVYAVNPRNGIDVNDALGAKSPFPGELEVAVPGGVKSSDIRGATAIKADGTLANYSVLNPGFGIR